MEGMTSVCQRTGSVMVAEEDVLGSVRPERGTNDVE